MNKYYFNQWPMNELSNKFDVYVNNKQYNNESIEINDLLIVNTFSYLVKDIIDGVLITESLPTPIKS